MPMLNFDDMPVGAIYYSVSEEEWFAVGVDDDGVIDGDRDFRQIAYCATFDEAKQAALQATDVRGRIYIDQMEKHENGSAWGSPVFAGYKSELRAGLRIPVQSAVSRSIGAAQVA
jgi:hypothetical protein